MRRSYVYYPRKSASWSVNDRLIINRYSCLTPKRYNNISNTGLRQPYLRSMAWFIYFFLLDIDAHVGSKVVPVPNGRCAAEKTEDFWAKKKNGRLIK